MDHDNLREDHDIRILVSSEIRKELACQKLTGVDGKCRHE